MRQFVVLAHDAPTEPTFSLDDLPGSGRMDLLARAVTSTILLSHGVRDDTRIHLVLDDALTITVDGATVRRLNPDERSTAALLRTALEHRDEAIGHQPAESTPGIELRRRGLDPTIEAIDRESTILTLHADGEPIADVEPPENPAFVLSDHHDFGESERALLDDRGTREVSLGPRALHADQAITVAHNYLDTEGFQRY